MRAADTNVIVRLVTRDDEQQYKVALEFVRPGAWVSVLALAEAVWVLSKTYRLKAAELANTVDLLLSNENLTIEDAETVEIALELFRSRPTLSFTDCLLLHLARKAGHLPLGTFDRSLARVEGAQRL